MRRLTRSDRAFLLAPKKRQFDPFGQSLRGKLRRLVTRDDGFDNSGRPKSLLPILARPFGAKAESNWESKKGAKLLVWRPQFQTPNSAIAQPK